MSAGSCEDLASCHPALARVLIAGVARSCCCKRSASSCCFHEGRFPLIFAAKVDEAAVSAANKIQFKPALRDGSPMDSTAVVHVVFELAM